MQQGEFIDIFTLLHQVGISHYFMRKMDGQSTLKLQYLFVRHRLIVYRQGRASTYQPIHFLVCIYTVDRNNHVMTQIHALWVNWHTSEGPGCEYDLHRKGASYVIHRTLGMHFRGFRIITWAYRLEFTPGDRPVAYIRGLLEKYPTVFFYANT